MNIHMNVYYLYVTRYRNVHCLFWNVL